MATAAERCLGALTDIPDGGARGFPAAPGGLTGLFAIRRGDDVRVYVNACPHLGVSLDWAPDRFLTDDGTLIVCGTHGAEFTIDDGECLRGPCHGDQLEAVPITLREGLIWVPADAGL
jgi:nitrite reductase/ring-hydroxylating ferredoxin subunit